MNDRIKIFEASCKALLETELNDWLEESKGIEITAIYTDIKNYVYIVYIHYRIIVPLPEFNITLSAL
ncbi:hypothetical protein FDH01_gp305 [Acinetobacter phage vB_AbaM_ME3]|uniref:Uncharacterized protein n=1 Tax=Acinetobacter phage vB_AbaM_ME3 TaxID=1837876 RepID=A0A172Q0E5_9CAUD|nr:hypothetical protein FDH01_gp305 [Acinetobacter phage vB_AbaM_ME3]AND75317.1 hypothetical protein ME3_156 [Acinetobacter phage vB_AbaM_ME3]